ncbi:hypothetical protein FNU76_10860 [Chitinimonas arctica]|uniref:Uncharacterized protein n=1 Tax=Chitinimonas arctica TaxID=2594795 RepID=A0A516SF84_9NEIS|nr:hypothetical protein [Chitinimonas arctica]QDQ26825.1 hypothetical protein FNU76_10860 [Chitinimonas arctica]
MLNHNAAVRSFNLRADALVDVLKKAEFIKRRTVDGAGEITISQVSLISAMEQAAVCRGSLLQRFFGGLQNLFFGRADTRRLQAQADIGLITRALNNVPKRNVVNVDYSERLVARDLIILAKKEELNVRAGYKNVEIAFDENDGQVYMRKNGYQRTTSEKLFNVYECRVM